MENGAAVKSQDAVEQCAGIYLHKQIHDSHANGDPKHQIWDALIAVLVAEPLKISA